MKYIVKEISEPMAVHKVELILCRLDKASLIKPDNRYAKLTGGQRYDMVRDMTTFADLKRLLYDEQGGICCYCGAKLEYPVNSRSRVEHVKPKNIHPELVGEYENLLLSCDLTEEEYCNMRNAPKKGRKNFLHCDIAKESTEITYSPLNPECEKVFIYKIDGTIEGINKDAKDDIDTLKLGCDYLVRRRREAINALFDDDELLSEELLKEYKEKVLSRDKDNRHAEFCFVLSNVIEQFIS